MNSGKIYNHQYQENIVDKQNEEIDFISVSSDEEYVVVDYESDDGDFEEMPPSNYSSDEGYQLKEYSEIPPMIESLENKVSETFSVDKDTSLLLLENYSWSTDCIAVACASEDPQYNALITNSPDTAFANLLVQLYQNEYGDNVKICGICYDEFPAINCFTLGCDHWFCSPCIRLYLKHQVDEKGAHCLKTTCPSYQCPKRITRSIYQRFLDRATFEKYNMLIADNIVHASKNMRYCPFPRCMKVVVSNGESNIHCSCNAIYCFHCGESPHSNIPCSKMDEIARILEQEQRHEQALLEEELALFQALEQEQREQREQEQRHLEAEERRRLLISQQRQEDHGSRELGLVITKNCPNCKVDIEKYGGCDHMTCTMPGCGFEFCWLCCGKWDSRHICSL